MNPQFNAEHSEVLVTITTLCKMLSLESRLLLHDGQYHLSGTK